MLMHAIDNPVACFSVADLTFAIQNCVYQIDCINGRTRLFTLFNWKNEMRNFNLRYHSSLCLGHAWSIRRDHVLQSRCCMVQLCVVGLFFLGP